MPGQRRRQLWTSREVVLSSDLTRLGKLSNMEFQDAELLRSVPADFYAPASNAFDDFGSAVKDAVSVGINGLTKPPSLDPVVGSFNLTLGAGEGEVIGSGVIPADESSYQVCRWGAQAIVWPLDAQPNPTNPKICLIIATPADVSAESQSRQILVNPDTRETSPATVYKLSQPQATISVLSGTAAATPVPPACTAGSLPLFEVIVPAGATDSQEYQFVRRSWRRIEFPGTSQHGILSGCVPDLDGASSQFLPSGVHRLVIDGELLTFNATKALVMTPDTAHPAGAAPATNDMATYLYLCGGRNTPTRKQTVDLAIPPGPAGNYAPVILIETTTVPDALGYPMADLAVGGVTFARGACLYIGLKFRNAGATTNCLGFHDGDWFRFLSPCSEPTYFKAFGAKEPAYSAHPDSQGVSLLSQPAISTAVEVIGGVAIGASANTASFTANGEIWGVASTAGAGGFTGYTPTRRLNSGAMANLALTSVDAMAIVIPAAYNMNVPRL